MGLESWSGDEIESEEIEESPPIPEAHMELPESWTPPAWEPELSSGEQDSTAGLEAFKNRPRPAWMEAPATDSVDLAASKEAIEPLAPEVVADIRKRIAEENPIDYDNLKFEFGSPHEEYELAKNLAAAQRRTEIASAANTADSLPDAILITLKAAKEAKGEIDKDTAAVNEWMLLRYGPAPYTTNAYPQQEDDPGLADEKTDET